MFVVAVAKPVAVVETLHIQVPDLVANRGCGIDV
jgi:hypothetical protein